MFILNAGGKAMADGGDMNDVAVARETVMADVVEGGVRLIVVDGAGNYVKNKFYGETYLSNYNNGKIDKIDERNLNHFISEHPFIQLFRGSE